MIIKCPNCGEEISQFAYTCPHCGAENTSRKPIEDIEIKGDYEQSNFSYVQKHRAAQREAQAKEAQEREAEAQANQKKRKLIRTAVIIGVVAIIIIIIAVALYRGPIQDMMYKTQVENDTEVLETCEQALNTIVIDGKAQWSETMANYINNGLIQLFGMEWNVSTIKITDYVPQVWKITLECATTGFSSSDLGEIRNEIHEIYKVKENAFSFTHSTKYFWQLDKNLFIFIIRSTDDDKSLTLTVGREAN